MDNESDDSEIADFDESYNELHSDSDDELFLDPRNSPNALNALFLPDDDEYELGEEEEVEEEEEWEDYTQDSFRSSMSTQEDDDDVVVLGSGDDDDDEEANREEEENDDSSNASDGEEDQVAEVRLDQARLHEIGYRDALDRARILVARLTEPRASDSGRPSTVNDGDGSLNRGIIGTVAAGGSSNLAVQEVQGEQTTEARLISDRFREALDRAQVLETRLSQPQSQGTATDSGRPRPLAANNFDGSLARRTRAATAAASSSRSLVVPEVETEADEAKSPPEKKARLDSGPSEDKNIFSSSQGDGDGCLICSENFASCGPHVLCCLKCGHMYGKSCIEKWLIVGRHKTCPICISKANKKDIRVLYTTQRVAVTDTSELEDLRDKLKLADVEKTKLRLDNAVLRTKLESSESEVVRLKNVVTTFENNSARTNVAQNTQSIPNIAHCEPIPSTSRGIPIRKSCRFLLSKQFEVKDGSCRVGAFNEEMNMLVVSHEMKNSLYPTGCGAIRQFNLLEMRASVSLPIHQKQIRDMAFSLCQTNILLTVSLDKKAILFNCNGNVAVQTFQTECPLWSCCWNEVNQYVFYVGTHNGQIISYDIRTPTEPVATFSVPGGDSSPVCRLKFVTPAYQSNSFNMTGLIVQKLNSVWFCELKGNGPQQEQKFHQLPLEGPFVNVDFEPVSRHILVSTRPSTRTQNNNCVHYICNLVQVYSDVLSSNIVSANIIRTYQGGSKGAQKMCRSLIFSPEQSYVYACANGSVNNAAAKMWDITLSESDCRLIAPVAEIVVDFVRGRVDQKYFMTLISERGVSIFEESFN